MTDSPESILKTEIYVGEEGHPDFAFRRKLVALGFLAVTVDRGTPKHAPMITHLLRPDRSALCGEKKSKHPAYLEQFPHRPMTCVRCLKAFGIIKDPALSSSLIR